MTTRHAIAAGRYLGLCPSVGYVYSMFKGYGKDGRRRYEVVAVKSGKVQSLITFTGV